MAKHLHAIWRNQNFLKNLQLNFRTDEFYFWSFDLTGVQQPGNLFAEVIFCFGQHNITMPPPSPTLTVNNVIAISAGFYAPVGMRDANPVAGINPEFSLADLDPSSTAQVTVTKGQAALNSMDIKLVQTTTLQPYNIILTANGNSGVFTSNATTPPINPAAGTWTQKNQWQGRFPSPFVIAFFFPQPVRGEFPE